jgi:hypothetical protein
MNGPSDPEKQGDQAAEDDHRHPRASKRCPSGTPWHAEPHDEGNHQRHPRVLHPRLGGQPTFRFYMNRGIAQRPLWFSTHGKYFGRGFVSLNSPHAIESGKPDSPVRLGQAAA